MMAIHNAMRKCLQYNIEDRRTAGEIAAELSEAYDNLPDGFGNRETWMKIMDERARQSL